MLAAELGLIQGARRPFEPRAGCRVLGLSDPMCELDLFRPLQLEDTLVQQHPGALMLSRRLLLRDARLAHGGLGGPERGTSRFDVERHLLPLHFEADTRRVGAAARHDQRGRCLGLTRAERFVVELDEHLPDPDRVTLACQQALNAAAHLAGDADAVPLETAIDRDQPFRHDAAPLRRSERDDDHGEHGDGRDRAGHYPPAVAARRTCRALIRTDRFGQRRPGQNARPGGPERSRRIPQPCRHVCRASKMQSTARARVMGSPERRSRACCARRKHPRSRALAGSPLALFRATVHRRQR